MHSLSRTYRLLKSLLSSDRTFRENLIWNLKRVLVEHLYDSEIREIYDAIDSQDIKLVRTLMRAFRYATPAKDLGYLEPTLIRCETLTDFLEDDD